MSSASCVVRLLPKGALWALGASALGNISVTGHGLYRRPLSAPKGPLTETEADRTARTPGQTFRASRRSHGFLSTALLTALNGPLIMVDHGPEHAVI
ncbi:hypothetical protein CMUS01_15491 [Colletotrichum musicola]|uniref:Uncharacterized protein n=1 Tax=Colletotrichum musicola TaxID=2175873 RepID=A0A8H6MMC3_9PEZI|nr:hypothetical protein CMUS01_15491 [Colletotrichum musicola]